MFCGVLAILLGCLLLSPAPVAAQGSDAELGLREAGNDDGPVYQGSQPSRPLLSLEQDDDEELQLETPLGCVEHFILASREENWHRAAAALDFRLIDDDGQTRAEELARRFFFVLNQELWIDWNQLSDRPDAMVEGSPLANNSSMVGEKRRSIKLGSISIDGRPAPVRINRVEYPGRDPIWLFSAHTVDNIDELWDAHGPSWLSRHMPDWARERGLFRIPIWQWIAVTLVMILAPLIGIWLGRQLCMRLGGLLPARFAKLCESLRWPVSGVLISLLIWVSLEWGIALPSQVAALLEPFFLIILVSMTVWLVGRALTYTIDTFIKETLREQDDRPSAERRRLITKITVARHVLLLVVVLVGIAVILTHFNSLRTLGITMLTSAGAMAVILGLAGRPVLGNLIAGIQIALNQPFRIGDTVYVEDHWGQIEDITYVDVIVRTWDDRRLVMPIGYFVSNWFENWSKNDPFTVQSIYLKVDYRADVEAIREKFTQIVEAEDDWASDRDEPETLVTECGDETITLRLSCGACDPSAAWNLICSVREKLLAWLRDFEDGAYLPRQRLLVVGSGGAESNPRIEVEADSQSQSSSQSSDGDDDRENPGSGRGEGGEGASQSGSMAADGDGDGGGDG